MRGVDFASVSTGLSIIFWNCFDSVVFFFIGFWNCSDSVVFFYWILELFRREGIFSKLDFGTVPTVGYFFKLDFGTVPTVWYFFN